MFRSISHILEDQIFMYEFIIITARHFRVAITVFEDERIQKASAWYILPVVHLEVIAVERAFVL
jgi:hypothetical protein